MAWKYETDPNNPWAQGMLANLTPDQAGFQGGGFMTNSETGERLPYQLYYQQEQQRQKAAAEAQRIADLRAQGLNPDGSPIRPEYQSLLDPTTGLMKDQYQLKVEALDPTKWEGYQKYKTQALSDGPSTWAQMMLQKQGLEEAQRKSGAAAQAMSGMASARSALGMRGGLSRGARERIALQGSRNLLAGRQNVAREGSLERFGINTQDQQNRLGMLSNLMGSETDLGKYNKTLEGKQSEFNILRALEEKRAKDTQDLTVYQEQMKKWAAGKQADATAQSGGGGGK